MALFFGLRHRLGPGLCSIFERGPGPIDGFADSSRELMFCRPRFDPNLCREQVEPSAAYGAKQRPFIMKA